MSTFKEELRFVRSSSALNAHLTRLLRHMNIKVLIVEDNPITAQDIEEILIENGMEVVGIARTANQAINKSRALQPDILLMDIKLDGEKDGIATVHDIYKTDYFPVIYLTANTDREHVEKAYATSPAAFLSKPFDHKDLIHAIELAFVNHYKSVFETSDIPEMNRSVFLKNGDKYEKIMLEDIQLINADGSYCKVITQKQSYSLSINLQNLSKKITNPLFFRVHRSHIVNLKWISGFDNQHIFIDKHVIPYSKNYREDLMKYLHKL
ncbi:MAG: response regulator [Cyclobacteriaceae bacterium]|nr:response regulator [Cyclobacteriaceae bacterium]